VGVRYNRVCYNRVSLYFLLIIYQWFWSCQNLETKYTFSHTTTTTTKTTTTAKKQKQNHNSNKLSKFKYSKVLLISQIWSIQKKNISRHLSFWEKGCAVFSNFNFELFSDIFICNEGANYEVIDIFTKIWNKIKFWEKKYVKCFWLQVVLLPWTKNNII
jgi:hypothetical protein